MTCKKIQISNIYNFICKYNKVLKNIIKCSKIFKDTPKTAFNNF